MEAADKRKWGENSIFLYVALYSGEGISYQIEIQEGDVRHQPHGELEDPLPRRAKLSSLRDSGNTKRGDMVFRIWHQAEYDCSI